jgi:glycosyltransferase involved in cell wall biosynthesis
MKAKQSIFLYQNMVCPHESDFIRALANRADVHVTWVVDAEVLPFRLDMGITRPDCGAATVIVTTDEAQIRRIVLDSDAQAIHIVQGPRGGVCSRVAWRQALDAGRNVGLFSEPGDPRGVKGVLRRMLYSWEYLRWGHRMQFVLATGQLGIEWFRWCGYSKDRLYPFCYVTKPCHNIINASYAESDAFRVAFCGQLIPRKNVDILLRALARLKGQKWKCSIVGDGPQTTSLRRLSDSLGLERQVNWLGTLPNSEMSSFMRKQDLIVLPSKFDGWGAVVNEALSVGTPVICSQACGAAEFLQEKWRGCVVPVGRVEPLAVVMASLMEDSAQSATQRERICLWARANIAGEPVAQYFVDIMKHVYCGGLKPTAPWRRTD